MAEPQPNACTLAPGALEDRLAWIAALARDALLRHERHDLVLDLRYAPAAADRVREMIRNEQACCSFLSFDLREGRDEIRLTIAAPEAARDAADMLFEPFVAAAPQAGTRPVETDAAPAAPSSHLAEGQPGCALPSRCGG